MTEQLEYFFSGRSTFECRIILFSRNVASSFEYLFSARDLKGHTVINDYLWISRTRGAFVIDCFWITHSIKFRCTLQFPRQMAKYNCLFMRLVFFVKILLPECEVLLHPGDRRKLMGNIDGPTLRPANSFTSPRLQFCCLGNVADDIDPAMAAVDKWPLRSATELVEETPREFRWA